MTLLLEKGAEVSAKANDGRTALMFAARSGRLEAAGLLLDKGADAHGGNRGVTVLGMACVSGNSRLVELLKASGAKEVGPRYQDMAVFSAVSTNDMKLLQNVLEEGADVNMRDHDGSTPLMFASMLNSVEIVKLLLERGADVNLKDSGGRTALMWASPGRAEIVDLLRAHGAKE